VDFLRREDAGELPEVGLQAAASRLSQVFLQKLANGDDPEAHIESYSKLVDLLSRLNREIAACQQSRDTSRRTLGREYDPVRVKNVDENSIIDIERFYSNSPEGSTGQKPAVPPLLPAVPTATFLAQQAREARQENELAQAREFNAHLQSALNWMRNQNKPNVEGAAEQTATALSLGPAENAAPAPELPSTVAVR
jgi:hypothetical protein